MFLCRYLTSLLDTQSGFQQQSYSENIDAKQTSLLQTRLEIVIRGKQQDLQFECILYVTIDQYSWQVYGNIIAYLTMTF